MRSIFNIISTILNNISNLKLIDIPLLVAYIGISIVIGHCLALFVIGFPCSIYEELSKKKLPSGMEDKITHKATVFFVVIIILWTFTL